MAKTEAEWAHYAINRYSRSRSANDRDEDGLTKVPAKTLGFWIIKVLAWRNHTRGRTIWR